jgi:hypothetical protein
LQFRKYIDERLPEEYEKCLVGLNAITREAWKTANSQTDPIAVENEKQEQLLDNNIREQELDNKSTINQVF